MKYWLLTTEYPPLHGGGISTYCYFTAQMLAEAGCLVTVFIQDDSLSDFAITTASENIRIIRFNSNRDGLHKFLGYTARLSYAFASIVKLIIEREGKPDFIESQDYLGIGYYLTQFKHTGYEFLAGVPVIITLHSPVFIYLLYNRVPVFRFPDFWTGEMEKQSIVAADALISPTHFLIEEINKHVSLAGNKLHVIANPYKSDSRSAVYEPYKIVYYGKLSAQKGSFELLAYFKELWDNGFQHPLHIVGDTDIVYHPELKTMGQLVNEKYAGYLAKGLLLLHGKIVPSRMNDYIMNAHVVIVPSIVDNLPYVVMEAMSLGKVVLVSEQGGQREMVEEGVTGFLFNHAEPSTFGTQLNKVLSLSPEEMQRIGSNASQKVSEAYSFEKIRREKMQFLEEISVKPARPGYFPFLYQEKISTIRDAPCVEGLLSVVIPYYNMGDYIEACVQSVGHSTYKQIELIIINDGSTNSSDMANPAALKGVTVMHTPNRGLAAARNYGAIMAKGEFLAFLDADDTVAPSYYEKAIAVLKEKDNVFFAGSWVKYFENSNNTWPAFTPQPPYALLHNMVNSSGLVYKKNAFLTAGVNDKDVDYGLEDFESVVHMLSKGFNGVVLPEELFYYRVRTGSMFRDITNEKLLYSNKYITEKHKHFYTKFATQIINLLNANGPGYLYDNPTREIQVSVRLKSEGLMLFKLKSFIKKHGRLKRLALLFRKIKSRL